MVTDSNKYVSNEVYEYDLQLAQWPGENIPRPIDKPYPMENWFIVFPMAFTKGE